MQPGEFLGHLVEELVHLALVVPTEGQSELLLLNIHRREALGPGLGVAHGTLRVSFSAMIGSSWNLIEWGWSSPSS